MTEVEFIDVVDAEDHVIGTVSRELLSSAPVNHRVVHVLVLDGSGRILLQRPAGSLARSFALGSSVAGHVRAGESYGAAARREAQEELGSIPERLVDVGTTWLDADGRRKFIGVFVGAGVPALRPDPREVEAIVPLRIAEIRRLLRDEPATFSATFERVFRFADAAGHLR